MHVGVGVGVGDGVREQARLRGGSGRKAARERNWTWLYWCRVMRHISFQISDHCPFAHSLKLAIVRFF